jgi:hypothetical protein
MDVTFKSLHAHQQEALREWRKNVEARSGPVGLWVYGNRQGGSSTIAAIATGAVVDKISVSEALDELVWDQVYALRLVNAIRKNWTASSIMKSLPTDYDLFVEANQALDIIEDYWAVFLLLIDDLHEEQIDMPFWRKHIQGEIEIRLRQHKPTIIATDMAPNHPYLSGLQTTIEALFVTCYAER